jgi:2-methylcitrate dehydratase
MAASSALAAGDDGERRFADAGDALLDALACGLRALRLPECARLVGPVVPGATMAGGARVPGTSYELDPVRAAFCLGTLLHWSGDRDEAPPARSQLTATLGGVLAVADYLSRKALAEAAAPLTVRDVLARMLEAEAALAVGPNAASDLPSAAVRAVTTRVVRSMLGRPDAALPVTAAPWDHDPDGAADEGQRATAAERVGDANSHGVLLALRSGDGVAIETVPHFVAPANARPDEPVDDSPGSAVRTRFEAVVTLTYPTNQANKIKSLLTSRRQLEATPIDRFMALLVRN